MKTIATLLMASSVMAQGVPTTWTDCTPASAPTANREMTFNPAVPVKPGTNLFNLYGDITAPVSSGSCPITISLAGLPLVNEVFPACGNTTITLPLNAGTVRINALACPSAPGPVDIAIITELGRAAPNGVYNINTSCNMNDNAKTPLFCAQIKMTIG